MRKSNKIFFVSFTSLVDYSQRKIIIQNHYQNKIDFSFLKTTCFLLSYKTTL